MKNTIIISLGCLICFVGGLYLGVTKVEEQTAKWDVKYKETDDKVSAFVEVSDPNTVRSYIKQLNDIVEKNINGGETTLLIVIYDNNNERRYLGIRFN